MRVRLSIWSIICLGAALTGMLVAPDARATWSPPGTLASNVGIRNSAIQTAANQTVAAWAGDTGVFAAVAPRVGGFGTPQQLSHTPIANDGAQLLAMNRRADTIVMWQQEYSGNPSPGALFVAFRQAGGTFGRARRIARNTGGSAVGLDADGNATIAWDQYPSQRGGRTKVIDIVVRHASGRYERVRHLVSGPVGLDALAVNSRGQAVIVWQSGNPVATALFASTRRSSGGFGPAVQLASRRQGATAPEAGIDDAGDALIAWEGPFNRASSGTPYSGAQVASLAAGARFPSAAQRLRPRRLGPLGDPDLVLGVDHRGDAIVTWQNLTRNGNTVKIVGARRRAGHAFSVPQVLGTSYPGGNLDAAIGPTGASIVSWDTLTSPVLAAIAPGISRPFGLVTPVAPRQDNSAAPAVTIDSHGHATETWQDLGSTNPSHPNAKTPLLYATAG